jgi:hypothetical protein
MFDLRAPSAPADVLDLTADSPPPKRTRVEAGIEVEELHLPGEAPPVQFLRRPTPLLVPSAPEPLAAFACPVCFTPLTRATLMPCGHVCCGEYLFASVKTTQRRNAYAPDAQAGATTARCVVFERIGAATHALPQMPRVPVRDRRVWQGRWRHRPPAAGHLCTLIE